MKKDSKRKCVVKIRSHGFTLIELLAVIAILAIVVSVAVYFAVRIINSSNEKSYTATINNIQSDANNYVLENGDITTWMPTGVGDNQYQCVTVQDLIDMGYFKGDVLESKVDKDTYVEESDLIYLERNEKNAITKSILLVGDEDYSSYIDLCGRRPVVTTYVVAYNANGGSGAPASQTKNEDIGLTLRSEVPTRDGWTFLWWTTEADGTGERYNPGDVYDENASITLYANWEMDKKVYTITYNANGGSGAPASQTKIEDIGLTLRSEVPTRDGWTFLWWTTEVDGTGERYNPGDVYDENASITLYAQWEIAKKEYTITYIANGGYRYVADDAKYCTYEGSDTSGEMSNTVCVYGEDCTLSKVSFERNCHEFLGWSTNEEATTAEYEDGATFAYNTDGNITLYAVWKNAHKFELAGTQLVSGAGEYACGYVHSYAYASYCSKCQMSASHYARCYLNGKLIAAQWCPCNWKSGRLDDAVLYTKDIRPSITRYKTEYLTNLGTSYISSGWIRYHGGINEGSEKLEQYDKLDTPKYCEHHN